MGHVDENADVKKKNVDLAEIWHGSVSSYSERHGHVDLCYVNVNADADADVKKVLS